MRVAVHDCEYYTVVSISVFIVNCLRIKKNISRTIENVSILSLNHMHDVDGVYMNCHYSLVLYVSYKTLVKPSSM